MNAVMSGGMVLVGAAEHADQFAAVASFHGSNLATDASISPVNFVPKLQAEVYIAATDNDPHYPQDMASRFEGKLVRAGVSYRVQTYVGASHG